MDQRNISQCCSTQFILRQQSIAEQDFLQGLRLELNGRFLQFKTTVSTLRTCELVHNNCNNERNTSSTQLAKCKHNTLGAYK